jgi:hypothetical protein
MPGLPLLAGAALDDVYGAVIVAVIPVGVVQPAADEVIDVVAVGHGFVPAVFPVAVRGLVPRRARAAAVRVLRGNLQAALVDMIAVHRVEAPAVQVVDVVSVADGGVPAALAVDVGVLGVDAVLRHGQPSFIPESAAKGYNGFEEAFSLTRRPAFVSSAWTAARRCRCCGRG